MLFCGRFLLERIASIFPRYYDNQNAAKLTLQQKEETSQILSKPPSEYGLPESFWAIRPLRSYIHATFGVEYQSVESYGATAPAFTFSADNQVEIKAIAVIPEMQWRGYGQILLKKISEE